MTGAPTRGTAAGHEERAKSKEMDMIYGYGLIRAFSDSLLTLGD